MIKDKNKKEFYSGMTNFMGIDVPFEIENYVMRLFIGDEGIVRDLFYEKMANGAYTFRSTPKPLEIITLAGLTNDKRYCVTVYFKNNHYSSPNVLPRGTVTINIYFHHLVVTDLFAKGLGSSYITMTSKHFFKFLSMVPHYVPVNIDGRKFSLDLNFPSQKMIAHVGFRNYDVEVKPSLKWSTDFSSIDYAPGFCFTFSKPVGQTTAIAFVDAWNKLLSYLFMRTNIFPDSICFSVGANESHLYIAKPTQEKDLIEDLNTLYSDSVEWCDIYEHISVLFNFICNDDLYMLNLKDSIRERLSAGIYTAGLDAAAFESEYSKLYPNGFKHSAQTIKAEEEANIAIGQLVTESSGQKRKIYKKLQKYIESDTLQTKMEMAFKDNEPCLKNLKQRFASKIGYDVIASNCATFRNDVDHGNKNGEICNELVCSFIMLRGLVYSMQLRRCGVESEKINMITNKLFNIKV